MAYINAQDAESCKLLLELAAGVTAIPEAAYMLAKVCDLSVHLQIAVIWIGMIHTHDTRYCGTIRRGLCVSQDGMSLQACGSGFIDKVESHLTDTDAIQPAVLLLVRCAAVMDDADLQTRVARILARSAEPVYLRKRLMWIPMSTDDCLKLFRVLANKRLDGQAGGLLVQDMISAVTGKVTVTSKLPCTWYVLPAKFETFFRRCVHPDFSLLACQQSRILHNALAFCCGSPKCAHLLVRYCAVLLMLLQMPLHSFWTFGMAARYGHQDQVSA